MASEVRGYWLMTWLGLFANVVALPVIGLVTFTNQDLQTVNISLAFGLAWPAAIVGIVASAGLLAERRWGVIVAIVALSMALAGSLPYGIVRLVLAKASLVPDSLALGGVSLLMFVLNLLALLYWCRPIHRQGGRL
ncbi:MAG: hypothetical protein AB8A46_07670 [Prochlorococcus sp.]|jgi:hypothetical protein|nr:hypothetical protein [Prochlorococcus sp.]MDP6193975.1 hypothetical protein [Prochlorococcaceae cyanobacterium ETNP18_MAG_1]CAI8176158.1 MAG: Uncharacterised protein [Prochlorococcus marinus str. MIT 9215]